MPYRKPTTFVNGKQMVLARFVMEQHLGRPLLTTELVHHENHDPFDNRIENLTIVSRAEHKRLHPEIGIKTRLQKVWLIDETSVLSRFPKESCSAIAKTIGCGEITVRRIVKKKFKSVNLRHINSKQDRREELQKWLAF